MNEYKAFGNREIHPSELPSGLSLMIYKYSTEIKCSFGKYRVIFIIVSTWFIKCGGDLCNGM